MLYRYVQCLHVDGEGIYFLFLLLPLLVALLFLPLPALFRPFFSFFAGELAEAAVDAAAFDEEAPVDAALSVDDADVDAFPALSDDAALPLPFDADAAGFFFGEAAFFFGLFALALFTFGFAAAVDFALGFAAEAEKFEEIGRFFCLFQSIDRDVPGFAFFAVEAVFFFAGAEAEAVELEVFVAVAAFLFGAFFAGDADRLRLLVVAVVFVFAFPAAAEDDEDFFFFSVELDFFVPLGVFDRLRGLAVEDFFAAVVVAVVFFLFPDEDDFALDFAANLKLPLAPTPLVCFNV